MMLFWLLIIGILEGVYSASICNHVTDVIVLVESKSSTIVDSNGGFNLHKETALNIIHRLPMKRDNVRVTVVQFNEDHATVKVTFEDFDRNVSDPFVIHNQKKSYVLEKTSNMQLMKANNTKNDEGVLKAFRLVLTSVLPKISGHSTVLKPPSKYSRIILVTILSGYWSKPNIFELASVYLKLSQRGVLSYIAAFDMKERPSESVLPLIVSKSHFLILPKLFQSETTAGHLAEEFQVCWKDGPCWPHNPCYYGCECLTSSDTTGGFVCKSHKPYWEDANCMMPAPMLECLSDRMELRLPKHYVTELKASPKDLFIFVGINQKQLESKASQDCLAKVIDKPGIDDGSTLRSSAMLKSQGFYYLFTIDIIHNTCFSSSIMNETNNTLFVDNTVYKSRVPLPIGIRIDIPIIHMRCIYAVDEMKLRSSMIKLNRPHGNVVGTQKDSPQYLADSPLNADTDKSFTNLLSKLKLKWDPSKYAELIEKNSEIEHILARKVAQIQERAKQRLEQLPAGRSIFHVIPGCHDGPYEVGDPCNPRQYLRAESNDEKTRGRSFQQERPLPRSNVIPPGCHGGPYEAGDPCNPRYRQSLTTTAATSSPLTTKSDQSTTTTSALPTTTLVSTTVQTTVLPTTAFASTLEPTTSSLVTSTIVTTTYTITTVEATTPEAEPTTSFTTIPLSTAYKTTTALPTTTEPEQTTTVATTPELSTSTARQTTATPVTTPGPTTVMTTTIEATTPFLSTTIETSSLPASSIVTTLLHTTAAEPTTRELTTAPTTQLETTSVPTTIYSKAIDVKLYRDQGLTEELGPNDAMLGCTIFASVRPSDSNATLKTSVCPYVRICWMEVTDNSLVSSNNTYPKLIIVEDGCPVKDNVAGLRMLDNGNSSSSLFSFQSIRFENLGNVGYQIQCNVTVCDCSLIGCGRYCENILSRKRRSTLEESQWNFQISIDF